MAGYMVIENPLTEDPEDFKGVILNGKAAMLEDVLELLDYRSNGLTESITRAVLNEVARAIARLLREGRRVHLPFVILSTSLQGNFKGARDTYDPARHTLVINAQVVQSFEVEVVTGMTMEKKQPVARLPQLQEYKDGRSKQLNTTLTPGAGGKITGVLLQINEDDPEQGAFAVYPDGSRIRALDYSHNTDSELNITWPQNMPAGQVALQVCAIVKGTSDLRTGELKRRLTVSNGD